MRIPMPSIAAAVRIFAINRRLQLRADEPMIDAFSTNMLTERGTRAQLLRLTGEHTLVLLVKSQVELRHLLLCVGGKVQSFQTATFRPHDCV